MSQPPVVNLVVVGDAQCGKTSLLTSFFKQLNRSDSPTFDDYVNTGMEIDGRTIAIELRDTVSSEACRRFRLFWYVGSHVVLLCFSIDSPKSLDNIPDDWMPELRRICPDVPVILVGNKNDLREGRIKLINVDCVKPEEGKEMSVKISAVAYVECSAITGDNVYYVFELATKAALDKFNRRSKCVLL